MRVEAPDRLTAPSATLRVSAKGELLDVKPATSLCLLWGCRCLWNGSSNAKSAPEGRDAGLVACPFPPCAPIAQLVRAGRS